MYEELREKAVLELEKKRKKRKEIQVVGLVFTMISIILFIVSTRFYSGTAFWIRFPIIILALTYGIVYTSEYGLPFSGEDDDLSDEEIEREIVKIYKKSNLNRLSKNTSDAHLELKEIEELKEKFDGDEGFV
ncbi:MAG: amino acid transporter [Saprospiraceae bacterium]|jgi:amino acid transporter